MDWCHAKQQPAPDGQPDRGPGYPGVGLWLSEVETVLFEGHAAAVADCILEAARHKRKVAKHLRQQASYSRDNQRRLQYLEMRESDFPRPAPIAEQMRVGSGIVESGRKSFREHMRGPAGAGAARRRIPASRAAAILSQEFDTLWVTACRPP